MAGDFGAVEVHPTKRQGQTERKRKTSLHIPSENTPHLLMVPPPFNRAIPEPCLVHMGLKEPMAILTRARQIAELEGSPRQHM